MRVKDRGQGGAVMRLVRYADDFLVTVAGTRGDAEALWDEASTALRHTCQAGRLL
jgi:RNA-directed DNA polymerase